MVMNDWNIFVILFNTANIFFLLAFMAKKIVWLRLLTITGMMVSIPYYFFLLEAPMWNNIFWISTYTLINLVMLFIIYLHLIWIKKIIYLYLVLFHELGQNISVPDKI